MADVNLDSVLLLMEHYLQLLHSREAELTKKIEDLAAKVHVVRRNGETVDQLVERVRSMVRGDFPEEEPPTMPEKGKPPV